MFQSFTLYYIIVLQATATTISPDLSQQRHFNYSDTDSESEDAEALEVLGVVISSQATPLRTMKAKVYNYSL